MKTQYKMNRPSTEGRFAALHIFSAHKIRDMVLLIPGHCCSTVNLHDKIYLVDTENVIDRIPMTAKGVGR